MTCSIYEVIFRERCKEKEKREKCKGLKRSPNEKPIKKGWYRENAHHAYP